MNASRARIKISKIDTLANFGSVVSFEVLEGIYTKQMPLKTSSKTYYPEKVTCLDEELLKRDEKLRTLRETFLNSDPSDPGYDALSLQLIQRSNEIYKAVKDVPQGMEARMMIRGLGKADASVLEGQEVTLRAEKKPGFFAMLFGSSRK